MKYTKLDGTYMSAPPDPRKKPAAVKVHVSDGAGVDITWADGHSSHYNFDYLRELCPCALCEDERRKKPAGSEHASGTAAAPNPLQLFKPRSGARAAKAVGHYALQIDFTDGHAAGIYSFDYLRTICPCLECVNLFRSEGEAAKNL